MSSGESFDCSYGVEEMSEHELLKRGGSHAADSIAIRPSHQGLHITFEQ